MHPSEDLSQYAGHPIRLEYEPARRDGVVYTDWVLFVGERMLYLGQDGRFVRQVLGQGFAAFIHEAFRRAGSPLCRKARGSWGTSTTTCCAPAWPVASSQGLKDRYATEGEDFFEVLQGPRPLVAHRAVTARDGAGPTPALRQHPLFNTDGAP